MYGTDSDRDMPRDADPVRELVGMPESQGMVNSFRTSVNERIEYCQKQIKIHESAMKFWSSERAICEEFLSEDMLSNKTQGIVDGDIPARRLD